MLYAASTRGFYNLAVHGNSIPGDAIELTFDEYRALQVGITDGLRIVPNEQGRPVLQAAPESTLAELESELCQSIDSAADRVTAQVTGGPLRAAEYERAAGEAQAFKDEGYPADAVPRSVAAWAINGRSPRLAADEILAKALAYNEVLYTLRDNRLAAKEQVRALLATDLIEQAQAVVAETIVLINALSIPALD